MATTITANGINFPDGSASAPSIGGTDTNTGLFTGSDLIGFATGGTERLRIEADGQIQIGLVGLTGGNDQALTITEPGGSANVLELATSNASGRINFSRNLSSTLNTTSYIEWTEPGAQGTGELRFGTSPSSNNPTERLRITSAGNVGIGTTSPGVELDIKSTSPELRLTCSDNALDQGDTIGQIGWYTTDPTTPGGAGTVSYINTFSANGNGADYSTKIFNRDGSGGGSTYIQLGNAVGSITFGTNTAGNAGTQKLVINSSGKVGIGTTSPATTLHLDSNGTPTTIQIDSDTESSIDFNDHGGSAKRYKIGTNISDNNGQFEIKDITASAERLRITSDGKVGIGTTSPSSKVQIQTHNNGSGSAARGHHNLLELKHPNTTTTGDGPALLLNGYYSNAEWQYAKISSENSGSGYGAKFKIYVHPADGTQGSNLVQALNIVGDGTGADVTIVDGNLKVASGHGIDFSADGHGSGVDDELLNDYEEGDWTPTPAITHQGGSASLSSISGQYGRYVKIGRKVTVWFRFQFTASNISGSNVGVNGLPFTISNDGQWNNEFHGGIARRGIIGGETYICEGLYKNTANIQVLRRYDNTGMSNSAQSMGGTACYLVD